MKSLICIVFAGLLFTMHGCAGMDVSPRDYLSKRGIVDPSPESFRMCNGFGCQRMTSVKLEPEEWEQVRQIMLPLTGSLEKERHNVARAIAMMEKIVGEKANTYDDLERNKRTNGKSHQLDCVAEATNTTAYLIMLMDAGLIRLHAIEYPAHRGILLPHNSAVLSELETGKAWAIDSWFHENGMEPDVVPLEVWSSGWHPGDPF